MRNYETHDILSLFKQYERHFQYAIVAHTHHRPYVAFSDVGRRNCINEHKWLEAKRAQTTKDVRYALNCFNRLLYPNATNLCKRKPNLYRPLVFVSIEGLKRTNDRQQTVHVNITLGNLPRILNCDEVHTLFRHVWHEKAKQKDDVWTADYYKAKEGKGWFNYSLKEAEEDKRRAWNELSIWDVENCWIPLHAVSVD